VLDQIKVSNTTHNGASTSSHNAKSCMIIEHHSGLGLLGHMVTLLHTKPSHCPWFEWGADPYWGNWAPQRHCAAEAAAPYTHHEPMNHQIKQTSKPVSCSSTSPHGRWNRTSKQFMSMGCGVKRGAWVGTSFWGARPYPPTWMDAPFKNLPVFCFWQPMVRAWA
jgi:hypothetical protein